MMVIKVTKGACPRLCDFQTDMCCKTRMTHVINSHPTYVLNADILLGHSQSAPLLLMLS